MVSSGMDDNIILLPSPDVQPGFDPHMGEGGGGGGGRLPHTVDVQQEQRVQPAPAGGAQTISWNLYPPRAVPVSERTPWDFTP